MKRWLLRWLIGGEDVYVGVSSLFDITEVHTEFEGASEALAGDNGRVYSITMVID